MKDLARKRFGQHFLCDLPLIERLVGYIHPQTTEQLIEIGPGRGALTYPLLETGIKLQVIELDRDLARKLHHPNLEVYEADALSFDYHQLRRSGDKLRLVGNLPYNISTPLLFHLFHFLPDIQDMHFMLQKEVAQRITAVPGNKQYGRLSIMVQYHCQTMLLCHIAPHSFRPPPQVDSSFIRLIPFGELPYVALDYDLFAQLVARCFQMRRKTIQNSLKPDLDATDFTALGLDPSLRPDMLSVQQFVDISNRLARRQHGN